VVPRNGEAVAAFARPAAQHGRALAIGGAGHHLGSSAAGAQGLWAPAGSSMHELAAAWNHSG